MTRAARSQLLMAVGGLKAEVAERRRSATPKHHTAVHGPYILSARHCIHHHMSIPI